MNPFFKSLGTLFFFFHFKAFAYQAQVIVHRAPLFHSPSLTAPVVQWLSKGTLIKLHSNQFSDSQEAIELRKKVDTAPFSFGEEEIEAFEKQLLDANRDDAISDEALLLMDVDEAFFDSTSGPAQEEALEKAFDEEEFDSLINELTTDELSQESSAPQRELPSYSDFYLTLDRNGLDAYIPKSYVKVIFHDARENARPIDSLSFDPTDYTQNVPETRLHPYSDPLSMDLFFMSGLGVSPQRSYPYSAKSLEEKSSPLLFLMLGFNRPWGSSERLTYGAQFNWESYQQTFNLVSGTESREHYQSIGFGPYLQYEILHFQDWILTAAGSLFVDIDAVEVSQSLANGLSSSRTYRLLNLGFLLGPQLMAPVHEKLQLNLALWFKSQLPRQLKTDALSDNRGEWQSLGEDEFNKGIALRTLFTVGLNYHY